MRYYDDMSGNASLHEWGYLSNAKDLFKFSFVAVYVELLQERQLSYQQGVMQTTNLKERIRPKYAKTAF